MALSKTRLGKLEAAQKARHEQAWEGFTREVDRWLDLLEYRHRFKALEVYVAWFDFTEEERGRIHAEAEAVTLPQAPFEVNEDAWNEWEGGLSKTLEARDNPATMPRHIPEPPPEVEGHWDYLISCIGIHSDYDVNIAHALLLLACARARRGLG